MTYLDILMVGIGGFVGAVTRYFMSTKMNQSGKIPFGTLVVNLTGAFLIGFVFGLDLSRWATLLLASGFTGALTTFSTLNKELIELWRNDNKNYAFIYFLLTYGGGMALVAVGYLMGRI